MKLPVDIKIIHTKSILKLNSFNAITLPCTNGLKMRHYRRDTCGSHTFGYYHCGYHKCYYHCIVIIAEPSRYVLIRKHVVVDRWNVTIRTFSTQLSDQVWFTVWEVKTARGYTVFRVLAPKWDIGIPRKRPASVLQAYFLSNVYFTFFHF